MAETSKRSWPWKKKTQDRVVSTPESSIESSPQASPHSSKFFDEQDVSKILSDHARVSDEAVAQWQHSESKLKQLIDKLSVAQTELTTKDILVKQHAKVAEEAVTGWEKAEAEAAALKQQLDTTVHQKLATEDRVSHLDGALKECMKQLRYVREEQEQRIHETIVKKTHEYDKLRQEMEAKLNEMSHQLQDSRLETLEVRNEAHVMSGVLKEREGMLAEVSDLNALSENEVKFLQGQVVSLEKEVSTLKYELHVVRKELEIRKEERDYERKVTENVSKNQLENVKKISKLEAECQKLRVLVRKKLPGPAALAQMKIEVDGMGVGNNVADPKRRRSLGVGRSLSSSPREFSRDLDCSNDLTHESFQECNGNSRKAEVLTERLVAMDDELKMLKEALARRDVELQESRLMCAQTASKLSSVEEQLQTAVKGSKPNGSVALFSSREALRNKDDFLKSRNAAPASLTEFGKLEKTSGIGLDVGKMDIMDDFEEMERLAMASGQDELDNQKDGESSQKSFSEVTVAFEKELLAKDREVEEANRKCNEVRLQLANAEEQLAAFQFRNSYNEAALVTLQEKLDRLCDKRSEEYGVKDANITKELEDLVKAQSISLRAGSANEVSVYDLEDEDREVEKAHNGSRQSVSSSSSSEVRCEGNGEHSSVVSDAESKANPMVSDLRIVIQRVVRTVEALAQATGSEQDLSASEFQHEEGSVREKQVYSSILWRNPELNDIMQSLVGICNKLLQGKTDTVEFLAELTVVLRYLVNICTGNLDQLVERIQIQGNDVNAVKKEGEFGRLHPGKVSLESHVQAEMSLQRALQDGLNKTKTEKGDLERCLETANERLEPMNTQLQEAEKLTVDRCGRSGHIGRELQELSISSSGPNRDMLILHKKVATLEGELQGERRRNQEVIGKYLELQQQIKSEAGGNNRANGLHTRNNSEQEVLHSRHHTSNEGDIRVRKDQEIQLATEKLAECQRSILDLGKQLKALSSPRDSVDSFYESDTGSSADRVTQNSDHNSSQLQTEETHSVTQTSHLHERRHSSLSGENISPWSTPPGNSFPSSPFLDRRSPSPPPVCRNPGQNGSQFGYFSPGISELEPGNGHGNRIGNGTRYHSMNVGASPAASEFSLSSLSVLGSPARSPAPLQQFRPRGTSPMRTHPLSIGGNASGGAESDSNTASFSRFYARTKSTSNL